MTKETRIIFEVSDISRVRGEVCRMRRGDHLQAGCEADKHFLGVPTLRSGVVLQRIPLEGYSRNHAALASARWGRMADLNSVSRSLAQRCEMSESQEPTKKVGKYDRDVSIPLTPQELARAAVKGGAERASEKDSPNPK